MRYSINDKEPCSWFINEDSYWESGCGVVSNKIDVTETVSDFYTYCPYCSEQILVLPSETMNTDSGYFNFIVNNRININYLGLSFNVDKKFKWIATDKSGDINIFTTKPYELNDICFDIDTGISECIATEFFTGDFKTSLREIKNLIITAL